MTFNTLGLSPAVLEGIQAMGFTEPTPIQLQTIPLLLAGRDVIGSAQTGTGKTAAFALPILTQLGSKSGVPRALILEPTRELAAQVESSIKELARFTQLRVAALYGGVGYGHQTAALRSGVDILVATPGRLLDFLARGTCRLEQIEHLVLDEADRMLDMGFLPDVRRIIDRCPRQRHTALFSATVPAEIESLIHWAMREPKTVVIGARRSPAATVKQAVYPVAEAQKSDLLCTLLKQVDYESVIVFCRTKHRADRLSRTLHQQQHAVAVLHSNRSQRQREQALQGFRDGRYEVLVATDIAARGLDVPAVSHVINFDVPQHPEDYVHRIGRTGRAQAKGDAFTLLTAGESQPMGAIERFIGQPIQRVKLPEYDYQYSAVFEAPAPGRRPAGIPKVRGVRLRGGYFCGPARARR